MKLRPRLAMLGVMAVIPTAVSLVTPMGQPARPVPVPAKVTGHALVDPASIGPAAQTLSAADAAKARVEANDLDVRVKAASSPVTTPSNVSVIGVSWAPGDDDGASVQYRMMSKGAWTDWTFLEVEPDHRPDPAEQAAVAKTGKQVRSGSEPLILLDGTTIQVRLIAPATKPAPRGAQLDVIDPGTSPADDQVGLAPGSASAATQQPQIYTRADWGADETKRLEGPGEGVVKAAFVHHTVHIDDPNNPNAVNEYTSDQVPGIIRGIYQAHLDRGYADIGYNFLVDRFGRTWEGRWGGTDRPVIGAHTYGLNDETFGVSVLGNFEIAQPPTTVIDALSRLIAWKASIHHFDPAGSAVLTGATSTDTYPTVEGHRAAKDNSTLCPGQYLYAKLPDIRKQAWSLTHQTERWAGTDRYSTAVAVSAATFPAGAPTAVVATGANFPDALAGGPAGATFGGPMLLTAKDSLPQSTATEIKRLKPQKILVLGGSGVVSDGVLGQLSSLAPTVQRVYGTDRYLTAAAVSRTAFPSGASVAFVATGSNFPDALAGGPAGAKLGGPMLLTTATSVPRATLTEIERLQPTQIVALGGTGVITDAVLSQIYSATGVLPKRWQGSDRYSTAANTSAATFTTGSDVALISTGADFPDALAGGPAGGALHAPLLLTGRDTLPASTVQELKRLTPSRIIVLGGTGVISEAVATQLRSYIVP